MKTTKIDWCDSTLNPVMGCPRGCPYCYARKLNVRYGWVEDFSKPVFFPERLKALDSKKSKSIFMDSMSDIAYWRAEEIAQTLAAIRANPQHKYIFLTKSTGFDLRRATNYQLPFNAFIGCTICGGVPDGSIKSGFDFLSIEPLLSPVKLLGSFGHIKQVIIGAETGNRKNKVVPSASWVREIVRDCDAVGVRVFMKESLREIMGAEFRQDPLLWRIEK